MSEWFLLSVLPCNTFVVARGDFHNNLIHGQGVMKYTNGDEYIGQWVAGLVRILCGQCVIVICNTYRCGNISIL